MNDESAWAEKFAAGAVFALGAEEDAVESIGRGIRHTTGTHGAVWIGFYGFERIVIYEEFKGAPSSRARLTPLLGVNPALLLVAQLHSAPRLL